jgi:hypothetical protein
MKPKIALLAAALCFAYSGAGLAAESGKGMAKEQYKAEKDRISAEGKAARDKCKDMKGNAKDICVAEARGNERVAKAELEARNKPSAKNERDVTIAKAEAEYSVAKERCDDKSGKDKDACQKEAKAARDKTVADAKANMKTAEARQERRESKGTAPK